MVTATDTAESGAVLFNCCTGNAAPDWSQFKSLEIGGCRQEVAENGKTFTDFGIPDNEAEFWTVYAREHGGCACAITDCPTRTAADQTGKALSELSGLPLL